MSAGDSAKIQILFCSGNVGKYELLLQHAKHLKNISIVQNKDLDFIEPQLNTAEEIALYKAKYAYKKLKKPIIVHDGALIIKELREFPGPYTKYVSQTIGCTGILKLLDGVHDRSCALRGCLVFIDENEESHVFSDPEQPELGKYWGIIAHSLEDHEMIGDNHNWSSASPNENLYNLFIPMIIPENDKTLTELSKDDLARLQTNLKSCYQDLTEWLEKHY